MSLDLTLKNREFNFNVTNSSQHKVYEFEEFRLDCSTRLLYRNDDQVLITPKAVETLIALVESNGEVIGKEELMHRIWGETVVEESNLAQYLHVLRKTLGNTKDGKPYIETLKRRGYRFNGAVRVVNNGDGLGSESEVAEDIDLPPVAESKVAISSRVERRGNLKALSHVDAARDTGHSLNVERSGNIYSVSDWRRDPIADTSKPFVPPIRSKWLSPLILVVLVAGLALGAFGIYKVSTRGESVSSRSVPFLGSDMTRLTTAGRSKRGGAISPDGKYVAHIISGPDGESLWVRQVAVANDIQLAPASQRYLVSVTFSPDSNFVYYLALERDKGETELFSVPVLGGPIVKVANDVGAPSISPDGTKLAFMVMNQEESRLIVTNADSSNHGLLMTRQPPDYLNPNEVVLVSRKDPDYLNMFWYAPAWSPDGKSIAYPVNQNDEKGRYETVMAVDIESRVVRKLTDERWQQVGQPRWLADGLVLSASEAANGPNQLLHISLPGGTASRITRDVNDYQNLSLTSDAKTLAVVQNHTVSNIWTLGESMAGSKQIMSEAGWLNELIWLQDGRLAYTSNAGGSSDIWTMNADGTDVRQLTVGANARLGLAVTVDGKQFIFAAERDGKYNLWRMNLDGSGLERITSGDGELYPQCTPDGRWIVYQSGGNYPTLRKMPIEGGESIELTKTTASRPSISPDGKFVAYHYLDSSFDKSRWGIGIISLDDGKRVQRFDFPSTVVERLVKWTRDGKAIAFLNSPNGVPNVWTQPLDGGAPKPLTNFPSDSIISFNFSDDGGRIAVIRGVETSDVVLINRAGK